MYNILNKTNQQINENKSLCNLKLENFDEVLDYKGITRFENI